MEFILYDKKSRAIANILPAQFLIFYETHFNAKIEHEDNFFIEFDFRSFWPTKNNFSFIGIDPTTNMSGYKICNSIIPKIILCTSTQFLHDLK